MITVLSVRLPEAKGRLDKLTRRLRRDKLDISIREARGVCLKHITYTGYNGKICLERADKIIGAQRTQLVCSDKLVFPENCGYKRFCSPDFSVRLCTNMALSVFSACGCAAKIKLGIYDINGDSCDFLCCVCRCNCNVAEFFCCWFMEIHEWSVFKSHNINHLRENFSVTI